MSEHLHAVVVDDDVVNVVVVTPEVAAELLELGAFTDGAELVDLDGLDPVPGIGWTREGKSWAAPPAPEVDDADEAQEPSPS